jgi:Lipopolysaccharide kinase (Kdo/WaaP) family
VPNASDYQLHRVDGWRLAVLAEHWNSGLQKKVMTLVGEQTPAKHPQTLTVDAGVGDDKQYFLKVFHRTGRGEAIKAFFRSSKGMRFWRQGLALSAAGFNVPTTIAAGELRHLGFLQRAFVLTAKIDGHPLPAFLAKFATRRDRAQALRTKRAGLRRLAQLVRRFHRLGFVHGDLVASNLLIAGGDMEPVFYFMDNDRTRSFPAWLRQSLWKRNLIQLNRLPLPGITLQDRMRFFCAYLGRERLSHGDRRFARWIENRTRQRRHECDGADPTTDFRKLMRWNPKSG